MDRTLLDDLPSLPMMRPPDFGITAQEYAHEKGYSQSGAAKVLERKAQDGELEKHPMRLHAGMGAPATVYCRPGEWPPKQPA